VIDRRPFSGFRYGNGISFERASSTGKARKMRGMMQKPTARQRLCALCDVVMSIFLELCRACFSLKLGLAIQNQLWFVDPQPLPGVRLLVEAPSKRAPL
jgi:hypothetical protein